MDYKPGSEVIYTDWSMILKVRVLSNGSNKRQQKYSLEVLGIISAPTTSNFPIGTNFSFLKTREKVTPFVGLPRLVSE